MSVVAVRSHVTIFFLFLQLYSSVACVIERRMSRLSLIATGRLSPVYGCPMCQRSQEPVRNRAPCAALRHSHEPIARHSGREDGRAEEAGRHAERHF